MAPTSEAARGGVPEAADLLCYCKGTTTGQFAALVAARPEASLAELCQDTGIGLVCTSCLLNAEMLFTRTRRDGARADGGAAAREPAAQARRSWRARLAALAERLPRVPERRVSVCPVLAGHGVRTVLNVSNAIPRTIGPRSARFHVRAVVRDGDGTSRGAIARIVAPGERLEADLSALFGDADGDALRVGMARITLRPLDDRYNGMVRPHFQMRTEHACAAVHTANAASHFAAPHLYSARRAGERRFVHVHNAETRPARVRLHIAAVTGGDGAERTLEQTLSPLGSALIEMPDVAAGHAAGAIRSVAVESTGIQRSYFVVADAGFRRLSVDHI
ncbi:MAG: hypothetical protein AB7N54_04160 [Alphaproteobacteria bacterium]